ncbi:MAG: MprA protease, GlyGly-CTERM protein-sorting domain-containing form [Pirellulales bacterium]|nr:MprA protease, GlyGly-CTERM protein-sorting domain-containing form [Pirellulales bacterium]
MKGKRGGGGEISRISGSLTLAAAAFAFCQRRSCRCKSR